MPLDNLPGKLVLKTRQQLHDMFLLWMQVRYAQANTLADFDGRPGGQPDQDANVWSDAATFILSQAVTISNGVSRSTATGSAVDIWLQLFGTQRGGPEGAGGAVYVSASSNGAALQAGDILTYLPSQNTYEVTVTGTYANGKAVPIAGVSTGTGTDLPAGATLTFLTSRPGVTSLSATVVQQADGSGLSGGSGPESDDDALGRLQYLASNPPASGNDAEYQKAVSEVLGIGIQAAFTIPGVMGPGTIGLLFTLRPGSPGGNRIPSPSQMATVLSMVGGGMPASDGIYMCTLVAYPLAVVLNVLWASSADGWADTTPFPLYHPPPAPDVIPNPNLVVAAPNAAGVLSALAFRLTSPVMTEVPQVGQNVGFLDVPNLTFRQKRILSVTAISTTQYDITVDTTNGVSDTNYTPENGQPCGPWSDSLDTLSAPVATYFDTLGPSEQFATFFDPGLRQKRSPASPNFWPNRLTGRMLGGAVVPQPPQGPQQNQPPIVTLYTTPSLDDVNLVEPAPPFSAPIGSPGVYSNLMTLGALVAFPEG